MTIPCCVSLVWELSGRVSVSVSAHFLYLSMNVSIENHTVSGVLLTSNRWIQTEMCQHQAEMALLYSTVLTQTSSLLIVMELPATVCG